MTSPPMTAKRNGPLIGSTAGVRIAGWAAVLYLLLPLVAALTLTGELNLPFPGATRTEVVEFFEGLAFDARFVGGSIMLTGSTVFWLVFAVRVTDLTVDIDAGYRWVGHVMLGGAILNVGLGVLYGGALGIGAYWVSNGGLSQDSYLLLYGMMWSAVFLAIAAGVLWSVPLGYVIIQTGLFPRWLGWALLVITAANLISVWVPVQLQYVIGGLPGLWTLVAGVIMLARPARFASSSSTSTAEPMTRQFEKGAVDA